MLRTHLCITVGLLLLLILPSVAFTQEGTLEWIEITSPALEGNLIGDPATRQVAVHLPPSYQTSTTRYPVFYWLEGYGGGLLKDYVEALSGTIGHNIRKGELGEMIVVFLDGYNRFGGSYYLSSPTIGDWETYIVRDLVNYVDTHYRTIPQRESRGIEGASMGGFGAMHLALKYPEVFGVVVGQAGIYDFTTGLGWAEQTWEAGATTFVDVKTWEEFDQLDKSMQEWYAVAAATAPNPDKPPFFLDKPFKRVDDTFQAVPEVYQKMIDQDVVHDVDRYLEQPVRLNGIKMVHGRADFSITQARGLDKKLTDLGIDHVYVEHEGGHRYLYKESWPFLSDHLLSVPVGTPAVVSAPTTLGTAVAGQPMPLEVTVVLDAPLESTETLRRMSLDLSPLGIPSELPLAPVGGGRYTGSTTITPLQAGQYSLPVLVKTEEGAQYALLRLPLEVSPEEGEEPQNPEWMVFTSENSGLPSPGVFGLAISPQGHIWMMCIEPEQVVGYGLAEFDGQTWAVYNTGNSGLPDDTAFPFAFDDQGNVWIGTANYWDEGGGSGVVKFDGTTWTVYTMDNSGLPSNNIRSGTIDHQGHIWVGTTAGVVRFDGETWTVFDKDDIGLPTNTFSAIAEDPQGNIWVGNYTQGAAKFDGQTWTAYTPDNSGIMSGSILHIVFDLQGNAWLSSWDDALAKFDGTTWTVYTKDNSELPGCWGLTVDNQGMIWAGGGGVLAFFATTPGVGKFDGQTWTVYRPDNSGMPARKAYALAPDRYGNMWMGTELGLVVYREGGVILPGEETAVEEKNKGQVPLAFSLSQNYPNPFNPITTIAYDLPEPGNVTLTIYAPTGQKVGVLVDAYQNAGPHTARFDGARLATGVYLYCLKANGFVKTRRMVLMK